MAIVSNGPAPYPPSGKVIDLIERHRAQGLPFPLTVEKIARLTNTPGLAPRVMKALVLLDLVDDEGQATPQFDLLATAPTEADYKARVADMLKAAYADVFQYVDPTTATDEQLVGQFRTYSPRGQIGRMVALFTGLCEYAGIIEPGTGPVVTKQRKLKPAGAIPKHQPTGESEPGNKGLAKFAEKRTARAKAEALDVKASPPPATGAHPFIEGLIQMLPPVGTDWPKAKRKAWADAALSAFDVIYELPPDDRRGGGSD